MNDREFPLGSASFPQPAHRRSGVGTGAGNTKGGSGFCLRGVPGGARLTLHRALR